MPSGFQFYLDISYSYHCQLFNLIPWSNVKNRFVRGQADRDKRKYSLAKP